MEKDKFLNLLVVVYLVIVFTKTLLMLFILKIPTITGDEVTYFWMSQNIVENCVLFKLHYPILYSLILSPISLLTNTVSTNYLLIKLLNVFISTSIMFPSYCLAKLIIRQKYAVFVALLSALIPVSFSYSFLIMSENLFYPLFLISFYFLFRGLTEENGKQISYGVLGGFFTGLSILTRAQGLVLLVGFFIYLVCIALRKRNGTDLLGQKYVFLSCLVVLIPYWIFRFFSEVKYLENTLFGSSIMSPTISGIEREPYNILLMIISHFDCLFFGSLTVLGLFSLLLLYKRRYYSQKVETFVLFSWIVIVLDVVVSGLFLCGSFAVSSRYIAFLLPLVFIMGIKGISTYNQRNYVSLMVISTLFLVLSLFFTTSPPGELEILRGYLYVTHNLFYAAFVIVGVTLSSLCLSESTTNKRKRKKILIYSAIILVLLLFVASNINGIEVRDDASAKQLENIKITTHLVGREDLNQKVIVYDIEDFNSGLRYPFWSVLFWTMKDDVEVRLETVNESIAGDFVISSKNLLYSPISSDKCKNETLFLYKREWNNAFEPESASTDSQEIDNF